MKADTTVDHSTLALSHPKWPRRHETLAKVSSRAGDTSFGPRLLTNVDPFPLLSRLA